MLLGGCPEDLEQIWSGPLARKLLLRTTAAKQVRMGIYVAPA